MQSRMASALPLFTEQVSEMHESLLEQAKKKAALYQKEYRKINQAALSVQRKAFYMANRERICAARKLYVKKNPTEARHRPGYQLKRRYKMTLDRHSELLKLQQGKCAICNGIPDSRGLLVDHNHSCCSGELTCGKCVRGLLCNNCNWAISAVEKTQDWAIKADEYLRTYANRN